MWRKALIGGGGGGGGGLLNRLSKPFHRCLVNPWLTITSRPSSTASSSVNSLILRSLKDHYVEVSKMTPPPKISPPSPYIVVKGALDSGGPVLKRKYNEEDISISVMRLVDVVSGDCADGNSDVDINQLFVHVDISKPGLEDSLHFLCGLYPDALGIHSVSMRPKAESAGFLVHPTKYNGPAFEDVDEKIRDALHVYIEDRGISENLFPFLQAWLYVKDHRNLTRWFKTIGLFVNENQGTSLQA